MQGRTFKPRLESLESRIMPVTSLQIQGAAEILLGLGTFVGGAVLTAKGAAQGDDAKFYGGIAVGAAGFVVAVKGGADAGFYGITQATTQSQDLKRSNPAAAALANRLDKAAIDLADNVIDPLLGIPSAQAASGASTSPSSTPTPQPTPQPPGTQTFSGSFSGTFFDNDVGDEDVRGGTFQSPLSGPATMTAVPSQNGGFDVQGRVQMTQAIPDNNGPDDFSGTYTFRFHTASLSGPQSFTATGPSGALQANGSFSSGSFAGSWTLVPPQGDMSDTGQGTFSLQHQ